jgi:hypothetical protein
MKMSIDPMITEIYELRSELQRLRELNEQWQAQLYAQGEYYQGRVLALCDDYEERLGVQEATIENRQTAIDRACDILRAADDEKHDFDDLLEVIADAVHALDELEDDE